MPPRTHLSHPSPPCPTPPSTPHLAPPHIMETLGAKGLGEKAFCPCRCSAKKLFHSAKKLFGKSKKTLVFCAFHMHDFARRALVCAPPLCSDIVASSPKELCKKLFHRALVFEKAFYPMLIFRKSFLPSEKAFYKALPFRKSFLPKQFRFVTIVYILQQFRLAPPPSL